MAVIQSMASGKIYRNGRNLQSINPKNRRLEPRRAVISNFHTSISRKGLTFGGEMLKYGHE